LIGFAAAAGFGWVALPAVLYRPAPQPMAFNHKAHTETGGMACADCHSLDAAGRFSGIPKLESCAACHAEPVGTTQAEKDFIAQFVKTGKEPEWRVYSRQPDNAWFPHAPHVNAGKISCETCHGDHGRSERPPEYRENRISGYSLHVMGRPAGKWGLGRDGGMRMTDCVACHRSKQLEHSCLDCHK
jgi:hypothetical protein